MCDRTTTARGALKRTCPPRLSAHGLAYAASSVARIASRAWRTFSSNPFTSVSVVSNE